MNINNNLISSKIHSTTPIKQGETTAVLLKEKLSESKAVLIIKDRDTLQNLQMNCQILKS